MRSTVGTYTCRHTVEILTWQEVASEQYAKVSAHVRAHIPELRPRRITFGSRSAVAA
jgi:hypothetical protein